MDIVRTNERLQATHCVRGEFSPDGKTLLWLGDDGVVLTDLETGEEHVISNETDASGICFSGDSGRFIVIVDDIVRVFSTESRNVLDSVEFDEGISIPTGKFSLMDDPTCFLARGSGREWRKYSLETGNFVRAFQAVADDECAEFGSVAGDGTRLAIAGVKGMVSAGFLAVYDTDDAELKDHSTLPYELDDIALSPDGEFTFVADRRGVFGDDWSFEEVSGDSVVRLRCVREGNELLVLDGAHSLMRLDTEDGSLLGELEFESAVHRVTSPDDADVLALYSSTGIQLVQPEW